MAPIRLVATDLDGTLLRPDRTISARTAAAMQAANAVGMDLVWATARARHSVHEFAQQSGFRGTAICANGAVIIDLADGTPRIVRVTAIDDTTGRSAIAQLKDAIGGLTFASVGPTHFVAEPGYAALSVFSDHHRDPATMELSQQQPARLDEPVVKIVARHPDVVGIDLYRALDGIRITGVELTHSGAPYVELVAAGVSKASALAALCAQHGIQAHEVAALGDAVNDAAMLAWAGTALCPANALPEVQALADRVLPANDADGVAVYLEELVAAVREAAR
ncbi:Cof-type HAD-IIB family hydrolase [Aldersonia sp. NBC_00410]|uniref:HAD family hydrolase n=1 Tax=Aldersonia sp. NBC_00410 TaxID=2975954 RepID=UPI002258B62F|nr:HAD family hydrolase [Aldersonia sp. NBC_00410]MCX5043660.1 Cof-type HAD-IIB family hydrolase [Aldersonia sp. NBC_00410]